jgi:dephospho-CoA kinase
MAEVLIIVKNVKNNLIVVTGKSGSGKSTLMHYLIKNGANTLILDDFVHEIYKFGNIGYEKILSHFGRQFVTKTSVNRNKLRRIVFSDKNELEKINNIIYEIVSQKLKSLEGTWFVEMAAYLDLEKVYKKFFKNVILVLAKKELTLRNISRKFKHVENFSLRSNISTLSIDKTINIDYDILVENYGKIDELDQISRSIIKACK